MRPRLVLSKAQEVEATRGTPRPCQEMALLPSMDKGWESGQGVTRCEVVCVLGRDVPAVWEKFYTGHLLKLARQTLFRLLW